MASMRMALTATDLAVDDPGTALTPATGRARTSLTALIASLLDQVVPEDEEIHPAPAERAVGLGGRVDDRLALQVERCVEDDGDTGGLAEHLDEAMVARRGMLIDGLQAGGAVDVGDGGQHLLLAVLHVHHVEHVAGGIVATGVGEIEELTHPLHDHRGREGAEGLAELDL